LLAAWLNAAVVQCFCGREEPVEGLSERLQGLQPQVERLARDEELHAHVRNAYDSGRLIYERVFGGRGARGFVRRVSGDEQLRRELARTLEELRAAGSRVSEKPNRTGRNAVLFASGFGLALLFNPLSGPATRRWLDARLRGSDEAAAAGEDVTGYPVNGQPLDGQGPTASEVAGAEPPSAAPDAEPETGWAGGETPDG
jgi:hypothetical protein